MEDKLNNILVVIESIDVDDSSGTKGRVALMQSLAKIGYAITAVHFTQKDIKIPGIECLAVNERKDNVLYLLSRLHRVLFRWFKIDIGKYIDQKIGFSFGFFNDARSIKKAIATYKPESFDMVWTLSKGNSYRAHKAILELPQWHSKWYAYVHDPYPQQLYPRPYNFVPHGYKQKRYFFRDITSSAKRVVFPSLLLKEWMQSYFVNIEGKSLIVPHQFPEETTENIILPDFFEEEKFNLLHAGNLLDLRDPKPIIEAYQLFLRQFPEAKNNAALIFIGKASTFDAYLTKKKKEISSLYTSDGYLPFNKVYAMQKAVTINIILEAKSEISPFLPGKFTHCVAANKPILLVGPYYSESKRLLGKDYSLSFDFNQVEDMAKSIGDIYEKWKQDKNSVWLDREDLKIYLSSENLKTTITEDVVL